MRRHGDPVNASRVATSASEKAMMTASDAASGGPSTTARPSADRGDHVSGTVTDRQRHSPAVEARAPCSAGRGWGRTERPGADWRFRRRAQHPIGQPRDGRRRNSVATVRPRRHRIPARSRRRRYAVRWPIPAVSPAAPDVSLRQSGVLTGSAEAIANAAVTSGPALPPRQIQSQPPLCRRARRARSMRASARRLRRSPCVRPRPATSRSHRSAAADGTGTDAGPDRAPMPTRRRASSSRSNGPKRWRCSSATSPSCIRHLMPLACLPKTAPSRCTWPTCAAPARTTRPRAPASRSGVRKPVPRIGVSPAPTTGNADAAGDDPSSGRRTAAQRWQAFGVDITA